MTWRDTLGCDYALFSRGGTLNNLGTIIEVLIGSYGEGCVNYPAMKLTISRSSIQGEYPPSLCNRDFTYRYPLDLTVTMYRRQKGRYRLLRVINLLSDVREPIADCSPDFDLPLLFETCFGTTVVDLELDEWIDRVVSTPLGAPFIAV
jgi:hypothetical protein